MSTALAPRLRRLDTGTFVLGVVVAVMIAGAIGWITSTVPYRLYHGGRPPSPEGSALLSGWLLRPRYLAVVVIAVTGVALTLRWERGRADRHEPLALISLGLAVIGHSAAIAAAAHMARYGGEILPLGFLRTAQGLLVAAMITGVVALALLFFRHSGRRGRLFSVSAVGTSACLAWWLEVFLVAVPAPSVTRDGLELARVEWCWPGYPVVEDQDLRIARMHPDGSIELLRARSRGYGELDYQGTRLDPPIDRETLVAQLESLAARMVQKDGLPDEPLWVRADRRAPFESVAALVAACAEPSVRIWKLPLCVRRTAVAREAVASGLISFYLHPGARPDQGRADGPAYVRVEIEAGPDGAPVYSLAGMAAADAEQTTAALRATSAGSGDVVVMARVRAGLPWAVIEPVLDGIDPQWAILGGLELLEDR